MKKYANLHEALGLTKVDIRDVEEMFLWDVLRVRTWNHRIFLVTGEFLYFNIEKGGSNGYKTKGSE